MAGSQDRRSGPAPLALGAAALAPLLAWGIHLSLVRALAPLLCGPPVSVWFYVVTALAVAVALAGGVVTWRGLRRARAGEEYFGRDAVSARYFGLVGVIGAVIFTLGILAQAVTFRSACGG